MSSTRDSPAMESTVSDDTPVASPREGPFDQSQSQKLESVTQIHAAAVNGDKAWLARVITANIGTGLLDAGDQFGRTPLMFCVLADRLECAELLLKAGAQTNMKDKGGRTALNWAAHKGNVRLIKLLLSKGADCHMKDNEGQTAVHLCTRHKLPKCMTLLLRQLSPGEIDDQDRNKRTALHWAASYGNLEHVKMLIKQDSNIGIPDIEGKTPLHWAASSRDAEVVNCVRLILDTTPSVINWQDYEGRTALHLVVADGNEAVVKALVAVENCNVSALDNMFRTPLHWAAVLGHSKIVSLLLDNKAEFSSSDQNGATPLHYAAQNNFDETVEVFLSRANVTDEADVEGRTAFMWAAGKGADQVLETFLKNIVDIQQVDKNGGKDDASSTPIRSPPNRFQKRVISMLSEMKSMLQEQARGQPITPGLEALESWTGGPCETVEEFGELENVLKSVEKRQQLIRLLSSLLGQNSSRKCEKNDAEVKRVENCGTKLT
ncbi:inversin-like isoform X2 [Dreissena polymorpha]|uniref:inversin-like isoform X2 n=1 Tax=Dreissena polymorpha TaxID=45954 RepID=UPI002263C205|nr:inversin-like isoform X2 [Dreissena polymorpha]